MKFINQRLGDITPAGLPLGRNREDVPLHRLVELSQVDAHHHHGTVLGLVLVSQVNLRQYSILISILLENLTKSDRSVKGK